MAKHYIIMSSSYSDGTRIALDITHPTAETIEQALRDIKSGSDEKVPLSTHILETADDSWESVQAYDPFFEDVVCLDTAAEFAEKVKRDRVLSGVDVANYILTQTPCTHLSLEKLVYFAYADYLCACDERLFEDAIYAFSYGPVVDSVYQAFKKSGYQPLQPVDFSGDRVVCAHVEEMPIRSRILFARNGVEKLRAINRTVQIYGTLSARELVELTHRPGTPWSKVDSTKPYQVIPDDWIKEYHYRESISS